MLWARSSLDEDAAPFVALIKNSLATNDGFWPPFPTPLSLPRCCISAQRERPDTHTHTHTHRMKGLWRVQKKQGVQRKSRKTRIDEGEQVETQSKAGTNTEHWGTPLVLPNTPNCGSDAAAICCLLLCTPLISLQETETTGNLPWRCGSGVGISRTDSYYNIQHCLNVISIFWQI